MASDVPDFTRSVEVAAGSLDANITNAAIIVQPASGATFAISGPVTIDTGGGPVYVNAAGTPETEALLAYKTNVSLAPSGVKLYSGDVSKFASLLLGALCSTDPIRLEVWWLDPTGLYSLPYTSRWDVPANAPFTWQYPLPAPYVAVWAYGASGVLLDMACVYGIRSPAPAPVLQAHGSLSEGRSVSIAAGATQDALLTPYAGQAILNVYNGGASSTTVSLVPQDYTGAPMGQCYYKTDTAVSFHDLVALPPRLNVLHITNNHTVAHTYHWSVTAV
jgi:hypothetical protein